MWLFKNDCCILIQTLSICLDCIDVLYQKQFVCSIPRPKTWYWLWPEDLLICTWSEKQKYLKNIYFFLIPGMLMMSYPELDECFQICQSSFSGQTGHPQFSWWDALCFTDHFNKFFFIFWLFVSYDLCQNDKFCLNLILVVVLDAFMGAQFDWLVICSVKQNYNKYRHIFVGEWDMITCEKSTFVQAKFRKCWDFFFFATKMKTKRLSNHTSQYFIHNRTQRA